MTDLDLRPYQSDAVESVRRIIGHGKRRIVLICPTGGGKTVVASSIISRALARGRRVLFLAHRRELIDQTCDKLSRWGVEAGVIMAGDERANPLLPVQVASVQTLVNRALPPADLIIVDECHHALSDTYRKIVDAYPEAIVVGLTATPWRSDKRGLADIYEASVVAATPAQLMEWGALVRADYFAYDAPELHDVPLVAGDYNQKALGIACNTNVLVGNIVREYLTHAAGRRAIVFPVNVAHSCHLAAEFNAAGVRAEHIDANTPKPQRKAALAGFQSGAITALLSVGVLTEGFDAPPAEVCILARPTMSLGKYLQEIGRVLRPSPETGKARALIHCHSGNILRHGFVEDDRDYSLTATPKRVTDLHTCPLCRSIFSAILDDGTCPKCGEIIAPPIEEREAAERRQKAQLEGERLAAEEIKRRRDEAAAKAPESVKRAYYDKIAAEAKEKNYKPGWVFHRFKLRFGHAPQFKAAS